MFLRGTLRLMPNDSQAVHLNRVFCSLLSELLINGFYILFEELHLVGLGENPMALAGSS